LDFENWFEDHGASRESESHGREYAVASIMEFVSDHPHSYASLAVCRRALDSGIDRVDGGVIDALRSHLEGAPQNEIDAYYSIVT